jgi:hypothetical protein
MTNDNNMKYLCYCSVRKESTDAEAVDNILQSANAFNAKKDITGVLLYSEHNFIQILEGDGETVMGLFQKIKQDKRHECVMMVAYETIDKRLFPSWAMGRKSLEGEPEFLSRLSEEDKEAFQNILTGKQENRAAFLLSTFMEIA